MIDVLIQTFVHLFCFAFFALASFEIIKFCRLFFGKGKKQSLVFGVEFHNLEHEKEYIIYSFHSEMYSDLWLYKRLSSDDVFVFESLKDIKQRCFYPDSYSFYSVCGKYKFNYFKSAKTNAYYLIFDDQKQFEKFKELFI